jgi:hypothetical protein
MYFPDDDDVTPPYDQILLMYRAAVKGSMSHVAFTVMECSLPEVVRKQVLSLESQRVDMTIKGLEVFASPDQIRQIQEILGSKE